MKSLFLSSLLALGLLAVPAQAAEYPAKPITLMTAFNAGGGSDVSHRLLEKFAKGVFDQPIVVTYKAGAGGEIGWTWLVGAKADGYTIGGVDLPHIVLQPMLRPEGQPGYKTEQLSPLCGLVYDADVVMVPEDGPYKTFKDLIEYAKANPGKVKVATVGKLTGDHLFLMQIEKLTGAKFTQVPYSGSGKAIPALLSGEVDAYFGSGSSFLRMEKTDENEENRAAIWEYLKEKNPELYKRVKNTALNWGTNIPTEAGRQFGLAAYHIAQKIFKFN